MGDAKPLLQMNYYKKNNNNSNVEVNKERYG